MPRRTEPIARDTGRMIGSPIVARRRLGAELRRLREAAEITVERAAAELECSASKISRLETGIGVPRSRDVRDLIAMYGDEATQRREELLSLAAEGQSQAWYDDYGDLLLPQSVLYRFVGLEAGASEIRSYGGGFVPGLLQTASYTRAIYQALSPGVDEPELAQLVEIRMARKKALARKPHPLRLHAIIDESAVLRPVGGAEVMREQLESLIAAVDDPPGNVHVKLLPLAAGIHPVMSGSFTILKFDGDADQDVILSEGPAVATFLENPDVVQEYEEIFDAAQDLTLSGSALSDRLNDIIRSPTLEPSHSGQA